jgi:CRISPR-associated protein Csd1
MLHLLKKYADEYGLGAEAGFTSRDVRWAIVCDEKGKFLEIGELGDADLKRNPGRRFGKCPELSFSDLKSGGETKCHFLIETAEVVALYGDKAGDEKPLAKHAYFVNLLRLAAGVMPELGLAADCLDDAVAMTAIADRLKAHKAKPTDKVTLCLGGRFPVESAAWHDWWRGFRKQLNSPSEESGGQDAGERMRCLVTGELVSPIAVSPKISGLSDVGGLAMGDALASYKQDSFCSYGLEQAANAAVSEKAAYAYRDALNDLIRKTGHRLAGAKVVHWFKEKVPPEDDPLSFLHEPPDKQESDAQQRAHELLESIRSGKRAALANNYYYALTLSGASGRVMVRDWMEGQFADLVESVDRWFADLSIIHRHGLGLAPPPKFMAVLGATVRELDDLAPPFVAGMWRVAVGRLPIPQQAMTQALGRARLDFLANNPPNHARMGLLKAYHIRKGDAHMTPYLNEDHPDPAYHCGRLMAVLGDLQYKALGDIGAGVIQRYYAAASITPALVLGRLVRLSQFHLGKLEGRLAHWYEMEYVAPVWTRVRDALPRSLSPERQSLFALGYYHQMAKMAADRAQKSEKSTNAKEPNHG